MKIIKMGVKQEIYGRKSSNDIVARDKHTEITKVEGGVEIFFAEVKGGVHIWVPNENISYIQFEKVKAGRPKKSE
jgi:hypothetical protein